MGGRDLGVARIVQDRAVVADERRKSPHVDAEVADQLPATLGIHRLELEGDAAAGQQVAQLVAARRPLLADDAVDHMAWPVGHRPGAQCLLHLRVQPLLGSGPPLHHRKVDPAERSRPLQPCQLAEGNAGVVAVHGQQQDPAGIPVQQVRPLQELHAVHAGQVQIGCHQRNLLGVLCQPLQRVQAGLGTIGGHHPVVGSEPASQRRLGHRPGLRVGVHDQ